MATITPLKKPCVILGASGRAGAFVARELAAGEGWEVLAGGRGEASFRAARLPESLPRLLSPMEPFSPGLRDAVARAEGVAVCLPIQLASAIVPQLEGIFEGRTPPRIVVLSSARRRSRVADPTVQEVIDAEAIWSASPLKPVLLRATMIFGDDRDANAAKLFAWARRHWWAPAPTGAGRIQPVFAPDLARAVRAALEAPAGILEAKLPPDRAIDLAGERPIDWSQFLRAIYRAAIGREPWLIPAPVGFLRMAAALARRIPGAPKISREAVERLTEDKTADLSLARELLDFRPRPLEEALALKAGWLAQNDGAPLAPDPNLGPR
jgi:uncharacterized protein YbjT (DUF2867 family)